MEEFTKSENIATKEYGLGEREIYLVRTKRDKSGAKRIKDDLLWIENDYKTAEEYAEAEEGMTEDQIAKTKAWREKKNGKRLKEDYKTMIWEEKPFLNGVRKIGKGLGLAVLSTTISVLGGYVHDRCKRNLMEGTGQTVKFGINSFKERERG